MDLSDSSCSVLQADGVDKVTASLKDFTLTDTPSPSEQQVDKVNEVTASLGNITLADTPNAVQYSNVEKSTGSSGTEQVNNHARETETQQSAATSDDESFLREQLKSLECPFTWKIQNEAMHGHSDSIITRENEKIEEIAEEGAFQWRTFTLMLIICYESFRKGDASDSWDRLRKCETYLNHSDSKGIYESFFQTTKDALSHVVYACKCHLLFESGILNEARQTLQNVCKFEEMDNPCKAAIWGIQAAVSMEYGYEGTKTAMEYIEKALELDPQQGEWHFLYGKCLGRIRRIDNYNEIPEAKELKALENAAEMTKNPSYMIFLAQAYREASFRVFSIHRNDLAPLKEKLYRMNERSADLYRDALALRGDCAHINIRCAQGFYKLPYPHKNIRLAKECCDKALLLAPTNAMANHVAGSICEQFERDSERAKKYYQVAGEQGAYGAFMDLYRLKYNEDQTYDPIPDFEFLLGRFTEKPRTEETVCQMGSFYLFIKDDLATAYRKYWSKLISQNPESDKLKTHKCNFVNMKAPVNIYEVIFDEARIRLKGKNCELISAEDCTLFRQIIIEYSHLFPQLSQNSPKPRRKIVLEEAESTYSFRSRSRRGRGGSRGRGRGRGRGRSRGRADGHRNFGDRYNRHTSTERRSGSRSGYHQRVRSHDSSTERRSGSRGGYSWKAGSRDSSTESRGDGYREGRSQNRESVVGRSHHRNAINRHTNRDSSTESKSSSRSGYHQKAGSRDSSTERRDRHYSKERNSSSSWHQRRDSSNDSRSSQDKNWRSGPRGFDHIGKGKWTHHRDSSSSSVEGWSYPIKEHNNGHQESRTYSVRSTGSGLDLPRDLGGGRVRTESNSSVGSDTRRDWREGCLGGGPRSRNNNQKGHWQTGEGSKLELNFGEKQDSSSNWGSWRRGGNRKQGFQRDEDQRQGYQRGGDRRPGFHGSTNYEREEARQSNMNRGSGSRSSYMRHNREESDAVGASAARASPRESKWQGSEDKSQRRGFKVKETNFKLSWQHSKN